MEEGNSGPRSEVSSKDSSTDSSTDSSKADPEVKDQHILALSFRFTVEFVVAQC